MKKTFVIPLALALCGIVGGVLLMGADPMSYIGQSALALVVFTSVFLLRSHYSFAEMGHAFRCTAKNFAASPEELLVAREFFRSARATFLGTGLLGLVMGFIRVLEGANRGDPANTSGNALVGFSIALITIFYGLFVAVVIVGPFAGAINKKLAMSKLT